MNSEELMKELYYKTFMNADKLYTTLKKTPGFNLSRKEVREYVKKQEVAQINKPAGKVVYNPTIAKEIGHLQIDLLDMSNIKSKNKNHTFIFICIDIYSRYLLARKLKNKTSKETTKAFKSILKKMDKVVAINTDAGSEFLNKDFQDILKDNDIKHFVKRTDIHGGNTAVVERVNRTLREKFEKIWKVNGNLNWIDHLDNVVNTYNSTIHSTLNKEPEEIFNGDEKNDTQRYRNLPQFKPGDKVRLLLNKSMFQKGSQAKWSTQLYEVKERDGLGYKLVGGRVKRFHWELQMVGDVENRIQPNNIRREIVRDNTVKRRIRKTGVKEKNVVKSTRTRKQRDLGPFVR